MSIIEFRAYKKVSDTELSDAIYDKMVNLRRMLEKDDLSKYYNEVKIFNDMLIEAKERKLKVSKKELLERILTI